MTGVRLLAVVVLGAVAASVDHLHAQASLPGYARAWRLPEWVAAVERHEAGRDDAALREVQAWPVVDLNRARSALPGVLQLMRDPNAGFYRPWPPAGAEARQMPAVIYHPSDLKAFRGVAADARKRGDFNRLLKRGALLHSDIARLRIADVVRNAGSSSGSGVTLRFMDGRQQGVEETDSHWELARLLLDMVMPDAARSVRPDPSGDPMVRGWFQASAALMLWRQQFDLRHFARAVELFPADADILFLAGSLHALLATPPIQDVVQSARMPRGVTLGVAARRDELRVAESLFRRALAANPRHVEGRVRLGRVLAILGRPADALTDLRAAVAATDDRLLSYYGHLLLGDVAETLGDIELARRSYEEAEALYPQAQSPRLALSQLARRSGDRKGAMEALGAALAPAEDGDDPWWTYHQTPGRDADARLAAVYAMFSGRESQ